MVKRNMYREIMVFVGLIFLVIGCEAKPAALRQINIIASHLEIEAGEDVVLTAKGRDTKGESITVNPSWSCGSNGKVSPAAGERTIFTALGAGQVTILATEGKIQAIVTINIAPKSFPEVVSVLEEKKDLVAPMLVSYSLSSLEIKADKTELRVGEAINLTVEGIGGQGQPMEINPNWVSTPEGSLSLEMGKLVTFKAVSPGSCVVTVEQDGIRSAINIEIIPGKLTNFWLEPNYLEIEAGKTVNLYVQGTDEAGNKIEIYPVWTSAKEGEITPSAGKTVTFQAISVGRCVVTAEEGALRALAHIDIIPGRLANLKIEPDYADLETGKSIILTAQGTDEAGNTVEISPDWSKDPIGRFNITQGKSITFTAGAIAGRCRIITTSGNKSAVATIRIYALSEAILNKPLRNIYIAPDWAELTVGDKITLTAAGQDEEGNPVEINPRWLSNSLGNVDPSQGVTTVFTATRRGSCVIFAYEKNIKAEITIEIR